MPRARSRDLFSIISSVFHWIEIDVDRLILFRWFELFYYALCSRFSVWFIYWLRRRRRFLLMKPSWLLKQRSKLIFSLHNWHVFSLARTARHRARSRSGTHEREARGKEIRFPSHLALLTLLLPLRARCLAFQAWLNKRLLNRPACVFIN